MIMLGRLRSMLTMLAAGLGIFGLLYAAEDTFTQYEEAKDSIERPVSAHQIVENLKSIAGQSGQQTEGTKQWRLDWWNVIINDTFHGPSFWTGRGFGLIWPMPMGSARQGIPAILVRRHEARTART